MSSYLIDKIILRTDDYTLPPEFANDDYTSDCDCNSECGDDCEDRLRNRAEIEIKRDEVRTRCMREFYTRQEIKTELSQYELKVSCVKPFTFNNGGNFFKLSNPMSLKQVNLTEGQYIEKHHPLILCKNVSSIKLRNHTEYLDDNLKAGWSCIVSNYSNMDLYIDTAGLKWFGNRQLNESNILIEKYTTKKIILVHCEEDDIYLWTFE